MNYIMNIICRFLIVILILPAFAYGGFMTIGGLFDTPTAYVLENTEIKVGFSSFLSSKPEPFVPNIESTNEMDFFCMVGLLDRVDVGFTYYGQSAIAAYIKGMVWEESAAIPSIAVGLSEITTRDLIGPYADKTSEYWHDQNFSFFVVASKDMEPIIKFPLTAHIGVGMGKYVGVWRRSFRWHGIFGGIEWRATSYLDVIGEVDGRDLNIGVRFNLPYKLNVQAGIGEFEQLWTDSAVSSHPKYDPPGWYYDEYDEPKFALSVNWTLGPIIGKGEQARLMRLKSRIERAEERLKQAKDRTDSVEREIELIEDELIE